MINPYKLFPIYNQKIIDLYNGKRRDELAPHAFAVADEAYRNLMSERQSQSMLVTYVSLSSPRAPPFPRLCGF